MGPSKFEALIDGAFAIALTGWGATPPHKCTDGPVLAGGGPTEFDHVTPAQSQTPIGCRTYAEVSDPVHRSRYFEGS
jgi:hypothetical protein